MTIKHLFSNYYKERIIPGKLIFNVLTWSMLFLLLSSFSVAAQAVSTIQPLVLRAEALSITPKEFYVADVVDERKDRKAVAYLLPAPTSAKQVSTAQPIDLQGGAPQAIRQFIQESLRKNTKLRPVIIRLKECNIMETAGTAGRVEGRLNVAMTFDVKRDAKTIYTFNYKGGARYIRPVGQFTVIEPTLKQSLTDALQYLNTWMNQEANRTEELARSIKVHFTDYNRTLANDTVFYAVNRPLSWKDFRAQPRQSNFAAAVFPGFGYEANTKVINGVVHIYVTMRVFMVPEASWVKAGINDAYGLNHEQRHFDIVKIVAERFKQKIQPDKLTIEDYNSIIQYEYLESYREMNRLQQQYDGETRHGIDQAAQESWNQRIDNDLRTFGVKKQS